MERPLRHYATVSTAAITADVRARAACVIDLPGGISLVKVRRADMTLETVDLGAGVTVLRRRLPAWIATLATRPADGPRRADLKELAERLFAGYTDQDGNPVGGTVARLLAYAAAHGIDVTGLTLKRDLVAQIVRASAPEWGGLDREKLADLQARVQAADPIQIARWAGARGIDVTECQSKAEAALVIAQALGYVA